MKKIISLLIFCSSFAYAQRCDSGALIMIGDTKADVINKCGEPMSKEPACRPVASLGRLKCYAVEELIYKPSIGMYQIVLIRDGRVVETKDGGRVDN